MKYLCHTCQIYKHVDMFSMDKHISNFDNLSMLCKAVWIYPNYST